MIFYNIYKFAWWLFPEKEGASPMKDDQHHLPLLLAASRLAAAQFRGETYSAT